MTTTVLRIEDEQNWSHAVSARKIKVKIKGPYARDVNSMFGVERGPLLLDNKEAIDKQILNILGTPLGSEEFEPTYGSNLPFRLFEPITDTMAWLISEDTITALRTWLGDRILIDIAESEVVPLIDEDGYMVNIRYQIPGTTIISDFGFKLLR